MDYATDGIRFIVTWMDLLPSFLADRKDEPFELTEKSERIVFRTTLHRRTSSVVCHGEVKFESLSGVSFGAQPVSDRAASGAPGISPDHAINLIIAKAAKASPSRIFRTGSNKIYLEDEVERLEPGIVAYKGFFSNVKIGMGKPILNVSLATTAFYESMPFTEFPAHLRVGRKVKGCYQDKIKTVRTFGQIPSKQTFKIDESGQTKKIAVLEYLKRKFEIDESLWYRIARSSQPCVNTSTRSNKEEWFPMETLEVVKYQPCRGRLSGDATSRIIDIARMEPFESLKRTVTHGLALLGARSADHQYSILSKADVHLSNG